MAIDINTKANGVIVYDIIGDIHGYADELEALLEQMDYKHTSSGWQHASRKVIFLGDFIDRGPRQIDSVAIARTMVENDHALAVMGNHEFNAIAYATPDPARQGQYLRAHSEKNRKQHQAYLDEVGEGSALHQQHIAWFKTLPLYLDMPGFRVIHACWHPQQIEVLNAHLDSKQRVLDAAWPELARPEGAGYEALETLLKGLEIPLPDGHYFFDKDQNQRNNIRTEWWNQHALTYRDLAMVPAEVIERIPHTPVPDDVLPGYQGDKPLFVGHYWLTGTPAPLNDHIACLDYSIAGGVKGKLCAYRWNGEQTLRQEQFVWVE